jgi:hypothetical protein
MALGIARLWPFRARLVSITWRKYSSREGRIGDREGVGVNCGMLESHVRLNYVSLKCLARIQVFIHKGSLYQPAGLGTEDE